MCVCVCVCVLCVCVCAHVRVCDRLRIEGAPYVGDFTKIQFC